MRYQNVSIEQALEYLGDFKVRSAIGKEEVVMSRDDWFALVTGYESLLKQCLKLNAPTRGRLAKYTPEEATGE